MISPDPKDEVDLRTLRDLATYQSAIYYHDDNVLKIPHAHVVVNNCNLVPGGGRVSSELSNARVREIFCGLQEMAAERGLSPLELRARGEARSDGTV